MQNQGFALEFQGTLAWEVGKHFQGEWVVWALHIIVYVLFPFGLRKVITDDPEMKNCVLSPILWSNLSTGAIQS